MEMDVDRERAERRLEERAHEDGERESRGPAGQALGTPRREPGEEREHDRRPGDHPVPELDVRVVALLWEGVPRLAPGPVLAAEARAGETNRRPGRDDDVE